MPTYKLYYFDAQGTAEIARLIFAQAGVEYEDNRLTPESWAEFKPQTPYGMMPVLWKDGGRLSSHRALPGQAVWHGR